MNQLSIKKIRQYDLEERTTRFAEAIIDFVKKLPKNPINNALIEQIVRSAGSVGANYCEATEAESKKDFQHKLGICKKEIKESRHWLTLLLRANLEYQAELKILSQESHELLLIMAKSLSTSKKLII